MARMIDLDGSVDLSKMGDEWNENGPKVCLHILLSNPAKVRAEISCRV
jgi:hypothetical protein